MPFWLSFIIGSLLGALLLFFFIGSRNSFLLRFLKRLPWLRRIHEESTLAVLAGILGTTLKSGAPLDQALFIARDSIDEPVYRETLSQVARGVQNGEKVGLLLERSGKFPPTFTWLVSMSEEEGQIAGEMLTLSERYFRQAQDSLSQLEMVTRPTMVVFLCVIVGLVVVTMFSALIQMPGLIPLGGPR
jgi:type IV pilus assembly protein PilC